MPVRANFKLNLSDYRIAAYYGMAQRNRTGIRVMLVVLGAFALYLLAVVIFQIPLQIIAFFILGAYAVWALYLMGTTEKRIRDYMRDPETMLGKEMTVTVDRTNVRIEIPEKSIDHKVPVKKLAFVFELADIFLLYLNGQDAYILPKRALQDAEVTELREFFLNTVPSQFFSRAVKRRKNR